MFRILLVGLKNGLNLGDVVINNCTEYLIKTILNEIDYRDYIITSIDMSEEDYSFVNNADLVIFTGGGIIKYKYQKFYYYIDKITSIAQKKSVPVIFNAVGVEDFDVDNINCLQLMNAINRDSVKQITTRDDINLLQNKYIYNKNIFIEKVADSAVWSSNAFEIQKKNNPYVIGLGVIREGIFKSNDIDIGFKELVELWEGIILELESRSMEWEIFTTGWPSDMKFAINFMKAIGRETEISTRIIKEPTMSTELVNNISKYSGVIAGRLHANIIAYSLKIPSIGIVWNEKCSFWGENIGFPERYFKYDKLNSKAIVEECLMSMVKGYNEEDREEFKMSVYDSLKNYLIKLLK